MPKKKSSGKRTTIKPKGDARYIRRDSKGRIKEVMMSVVPEKGSREESETNSAIGLWRSRRSKAVLVIQMDKLAVWK